MSQKNVRVSEWPNHHKSGTNEIKELIKILESTNWSNGSFVKKFETEFANFVGSTHALFVSNLTAALKLVLLALEIKKGDEIIVPGMTWPSVIFTILEVGAVPITVDIDKAYGLELHEVKNSINDKTKAVIATHLFCSQTDMPPLIKLCNKYRIPIIEDAAHTLGTIRFGKSIGTFGLVGLFSFNQKKLLTCGEGGILVTNNRDLYEKTYSLREVFPNKELYGSMLPQTVKNSEFLAAILSAQIKKLSRKLAIQEKNATFLRYILEETEGISVLPRLDGTECQTYYNFCFKVKGISKIDTLRHELSIKTGLEMSAPYMPFWKSPVFRHIINNYPIKIKNELIKEHKNINKSYHSEAIRFHHSALLSSKKILEKLGKRIIQLYRTYKN